MSIIMMIRGMCGASLKMAGAAQNVDTCCTPGQSASGAKIDPRWLPPPSCNTHAAFASCSSSGFTELNNTDLVDSVYR